jgi:pimeloyl-ACP methyl ester carboxylesterase
VRVPAPTPTRHSAVSGSRMSKRRSGAAGARSGPPVRRRSELGAGEASAGGDGSGEHKHLVVLVHGFLGSAADFANFRRVLEVESPHSRELLVLVPNRNGTLLGTTDGIRAGALRVFDEVMAVVQTHRASLGRISVLGHSLGGLYARYLVHLLDKEGVLDSLEPCAFATMATPHLGVRKPQTNPVNVIWHHLVLPWLQTTRELGLLDRTNVHGRDTPLLHEMATSEEFLAPLRKFRRRVLYANVKNDFQVPYATAALRHKSPYSERRAHEHAADAAQPPSPPRPPVSRVGSALMVLPRPGCLSRPMASDRHSREHPYLTEFSIANVDKRKSWHSARELESGVISLIDGDGGDDGDDDHQHDDDGRDEHQQQQQGEAAHVADSERDNLKAESTRSEIRALTTTACPQSLSTAFPRDALRDKLREMLIGLDIRVGEWERYDAAFSSILAHEQIINKKGYLPGKQVVQHFANVVVSAFHRAPEPLAARESAAGPQSLTST